MRRKDARAIVRNNLKSDLRTHVSLENNYYDIDMDHSSNLYNCYIYSSKLTGKNRSRKRFRKFEGILKEM